MYCPVCFNDTLKLASSGVGKVSFNGKSKSTSQFFYNIDQDSSEDIIKKCGEVVKEYFQYYSNFQNQDIINNIKVYSNDFKCSRGCSLNIGHKVNIADLIISKDDIVSTVEQFSKKYSTPICSKSIKANLG